jgi:hypothetical protein
MREFRFLPLSANCALLGYQAAIALHARYNTYPEEGGSHVRTIILYKQEILKHLIGSVPSLFTARDIQKKHTNASDVIV